MQIRCSALPLVTICGHSAIKPDVHVNQWSAPSATGTTTHACLRRHIETGWNSVEEIADDETRFLVSQGIKMWRTLRDWIVYPVCEQEVEADFGEFVLTGHTDIQSVAERTIRIVDWKSGRLDSLYREQMLGYGAAALRADPSLERAECYISWLRTREVEVHVFERCELDEWKGRLLESLGAKRYNVGPHCYGCARGHECPGHGAIVRRDIASLEWVSASEIQHGLSSMSRERIIELSEKAKLVSARAQCVLSAIRSHVEEHGPVVARGSELCIVEESRRSVDTSAAWPVLMEHLTDDELSAVVDVSLSRASSAVALKKSRGEKGRARAEFFRQLKAAGAIRHTNVKKLVKRREQNVEEGTDRDKRDGDH